MSNSAPRIDDLAEAILLDDLSDIYYRSLVFPYFPRLETDPKSATQALMDNKLQIKLARQIYWGTSITHLDVATKKLAVLLSDIFDNSLTPLQLAHFVRDNFWLKKAIESHADKVESWQVLYQQLLTGDTQFPTGRLMFDVMFDYYKPQLSSQCKDIVEKLHQLAMVNVDLAKQAAKEDQLEIESEKFYFIAMMNYIPVLTLIKVYDGALQSVTRECEKADWAVFDNDMKLFSFEPTAESLFNFLKFDEFLRPHIFESLGTSTEVFPPLIGQLEVEDEVVDYFLRGRMRTIRNVLDSAQVLTPSQVERIQTQRGIDHQLMMNNINDQSRVVLDRILLH